MQIYIDFDNDGTFAPSESVGGLDPVNTTASPFSITIPSGIATGDYRMRLVYAAEADAIYPAIEPCMATNLFITTIPYNYGIAIDYTVHVGPSTPSCTAPTLSLGAATCTSQVINWAAVSGASGYQYVVDNTATAPTGAGTATTATTYTATPLTTGNTYYAHVRTDCGGGTFSSWTTLSFTEGPAPITGTAALCPGSTTQLSDATPGGTWSSSNNAVATVGGGLVHGLTAGSVTISYTVGGCSATLAVTVGNLPAITGNTSICPGGTTQLADQVPGGTWSSSSATAASVSSTGLVTGGASTGSAVITYSASGCSATVTVNVASLPAISGGSTVCAGATLSLSDATAGGTWSSSNNSFATVVSGTGVVTGVAIGTVTITYTQGGCAVYKSITVGASVAPITGTTTFCVTGSTTLADATTGGTWSSNDNAVATITSGGVVHGVAGGTVTILYTSGGCAVSTVVTVDPNNGGTITGKDSVCVGAVHAITLSDNVAGGVWSSSLTAKASVDPVTGVVTGLVQNSTVTISYKVTNTCGTYTATKVIRVRSNAQCATGVNVVAEQEANELKVFPNPNSGQFTMNMIADNDEAVHVEVMNMLGAKVKELNTTTNNVVNITLSTAPGIYMLSATTAHGRYVAKVVIQK